MTKLKWDVIGITEMKKRGESVRTLKAGHNFFQIGSSDEIIGGFHFFIEKKHSSTKMFIKSICTRGSDH